MRIQPITYNQVGNTRLFFVMDKALLASFIAHLCFIPLFVWLKIWEMVVLNIFSITILACSILFTRKGSFIPAYLIGMSEAVVHAIAAVHFIGWNSGFHYYVVVLIPFVFFWPFWHLRVKTITSLFIFLVYSGLFLYSQEAGPVYDLATWQVNVTNLINVLIAFITFASVALYYQNSVSEAETNLRKANTRLEELVRTDPLTDLSNRRKILEKIDEEENHSHFDVRRFSIIMADIDHFKIFNDQYGHQFGDLVLISIANLLKNTTRSGDVIARWGGEEFLVLLPETSGEEAQEVADRMRSSISQTPLFLDDKQIHISMTFGVAECTSETGINECINLADKALYKGKTNGRNQVVLLKSEE